jgi:hypothetical protein
MVRTRSCCCNILLLSHHLCYVPAAFQALRYLHQPISRTHQVLCPVLCCAVLCCAVLCCAVLVR